MIFLTLMSTFHDFFVGFAVENILVLLDLTYLDNIVV
jgi:hypothetical protein